MTWFGSGFWNLARLLKPKVSPKEWALWVNLAEAETEAVEVTTCSRLTMRPRQITHLKSSAKSIDLLALRKSWCTMSVMQ